METTSVPPMTLQDYLHVFRRRRMTIVACGILAMLAALVVSTLKDPTTSSTPTSVPPSAPSPVPTATMAPRGSSTALVLVGPSHIGPPNLLTEQIVATSDSVLEGAARSVGLSVDELRAALEADVVEGSEVLAFRVVRDGGDDVAAARAVADAYVAERQVSVRRAVAAQRRDIADSLVRLQQRDELLTDRLAAAGSGSESRALLSEQKLLTSRIFQLQDRLLELDAAQVAQASARVIQTPTETASEEALAPTAPAPVQETSTRRSLSSIARDGLAGLVLGLLLGAAIALVQDRLDDHFGAVHELESVFGAPVLAVFEEADERQLSLLWAKVRRHGSSTVFASLEEHDGPPVGAALAAAIARGEDVTCIAADPETHGTERFLERPVADRGLMEWLREEDAAPRFPVESLGGGLSLVPAGSADGTLGSSALERFHSVLSTTASAIIVCDALDRSSVARLISSAVERTVLVVDPTSLTATKAKVFKKEMDQLGVSIAGLVVQAPADGSFAAT